MNIKLFILFLVLLVVPLFGRPKTDVIELKNGNRFVCEIKRLDKGVLYIGLDYVDGTVSVQWSAVVHVESHQLFLVQTQGGVQYQGELRTATTPADEPAKIEILESGDSQQNVEKRQVVEMTQAAETLWKRLSGTLDTGMTYSRGNNTRQYNVAAGLNYERPRWSTQAQYSSNLTGSNHDPAATRNQLSLGVLKLTRWDNWFYAGIVDFLQSSQQSIGLQGTLGGGIGHYFKNTNRARIALIGGFDFQNTRYVSGNNPAQQAIAGMIAGNVQVFVFKKTNLSLQANLLPLINQPGRVRLNINTAYSIQLVRDLWWKFTFYGNWDNQPPHNLSGADYGTTSGISYSFH